MPVKVRNECSDANGNVFGTLINTPLLNIIIQLDMLFSVSLKHDLKKSITVLQCD